MPRLTPQITALKCGAVIPNKRAILKPGLFGRVNVVVGAKDGALLVPESAVLSSGTEEYVYVVIEETRQDQTIAFALKRTITTGLSEAGTVEVLRGLEEGDRIVTVGLSKVEDRRPV